MHNLIMRGHSMWPCRILTDNRGAERSETYSKKIRSIFFDYPSTSFPKTSSTLNSSAISATITSAISTAAEDIF